MAVVPVTEKIRTRRGFVVAWENVRYGPITEVLRAAGVPLVWLLMLLQRRHGQPRSRQEEAL